MCANVSRQPLDDFFSSFDDSTRRGIDHYSVYFFGAHPRLPDWISKSGEQKTDTRENTVDCRAVINRKVIKHVKGETPLHIGTWSYR